MNSSHPNRICNFTNCNWKLLHCNANINFTNDSVSHNFSNTTCIKDMLMLMSEPVECVCDFLKLMFPEDGLVRSKRVAKNEAL
jgi:hypothetical protein